MKALDNIDDFERLLAEHGWPDQIRLPKKSFRWAWFCPVFTRAVVEGVPTLIYAAVRILPPTQSMEAPRDVDLSNEVEE